MKTDTKKIDKVDKTNKAELTQTKARAVVLWRETRGHISNICSAIGVSRQAFYNWLNEDPDFNLAIQNAEAELNDEVRDSLIQKIADGSSSDIQFYLKRRHPDFKDQPSVVQQFNVGSDKMQIEFVGGDEK